MIDAHYYPVEIPSDGNEVVWENSGGTVLTATIPAGTYYVAESIPSALTGRALFNELVSAMSSADATYNYEAVVLAPQRSTGDGLQAIAMQQTSGGGFVWGPATSTFTLDTRLLGYAAEAGAARTSTLPQYTNFGICQPWPIHNSKAADRTDRDVEVDLQASTDDALDAYQLQYGAPDVLRMWEYTEVPAAHILDRKANDSRYADYAGLGHGAVFSDEGDTHNAWEHCWARARDLETILSLYDTADTDDLLAPDTATYELWTLARMEQRQRLRETVQRSRDRGEFYTLSFDAHVQETTRLT